MKIYSSLPHFSNSSQNLSLVLTDDIKELETLILSELYFKNKIYIDQALLGERYIKTYFSIVFHQNKPIFFSFFQFLNLDKNTVKKISESNHVSTFISILLCMSKFKVLVMGNIFRTGIRNYFFIDKDISNEIAQKYWLETGELIAQKLNCTAIASKEIDISKSEYSYLHTNGFDQEFPDVSMDFDIDKAWVSFEDYFSLLSRKYASRCKKIREHMLNLKIKNLDLKAIEAHKKQIQALYIETIEDQNFVFAKVDENYWLAMKNIYQENFQIFGMFFEDKLIGFYSTLEDQDSLEMYYLGYDKGYNQKYNLYFNMLFLGIENSIARKKAILKLGRTSLDAKLNLGAFRNEKLFFIKLYNLKGKILDTWMKCKLIDRDVKTINRSPYKNIQPNNSENTSSSLETAMILME